MDRQTINSPDRAVFERAVAARPEPQAVWQAACDTKAGKAGAGEAVAAALCHAAFVTPEDATGIYAAFRAGWLGMGAPPARADEAASAPGTAPSQAFWDAFWAIHVDSANGGPDAAGFTRRVTALGGLVSPTLLERCEALARAHPKAAVPADHAMPPRLLLSDLERQPPGSLGYQFYRLIVDNRFDLEVLDRDTLHLASLPPGLGWLNTRILQMHDVWHLVGGFRTTALHEVAISAFQQAQFGHGYSAMFLAAVATGLSLRAPAGLAVLLQTIAEASEHGWKSPSFMAIAWEREWHLPVAEIRARHGIVPFSGSLPADLFEQIRTP